MNHLAVSTDTQIGKESFYRRTMESCDSILNKHVGNLPVENDPPMYDGFLHEAENLNAKKINTSTIRIRIDDTTKFNPCEYWGRDKDQYIADHDGLIQAKGDWEEKNKETLAANAKIRKENSFRRWANSILDKSDSIDVQDFVEKEYEYTKWGTELLQRETQASDVLLRRSPDEWLKMINMVDILPRPNIARIVWWDYFSIRPGSKRWTQLDAFLDGLDWVKGVSDSEIEFWLLFLGYTPIAAKRRSRSGRTHKAV